MRRQLTPTTLRHLSGMHLTVVCLLILAVLTVWGTLYQVSHGLFAARQRFFDSWFILIWGVVPFPGVRLIGAVCLVNLGAAALMRFSWRWRSAGIILIHAGVAILLLGGAISCVLTQEAVVTLTEGTESSTAFSTSEWELVVGYPNGHEVCRSFRQCRSGQRLDLLENLTVEVYKTYRDCLVKRNSSGTVVNLVCAQGLKRDGSPIPGIILTVSEGERRKRLVVHGADTVYHFLAVGGKSVYFLLRPAKVVLPVSIRLLQFSASYHPGTTTPRHYASRVRLVGTDVDREAVILMNRPLRYRAYAFYQAWHSSSPGDVVQSTLMVVRNPVRSVPYFASLLVCAGLLIHFVISFVALRKGRLQSETLTSNRPASASAGAATIGLVMIFGLFTQGTCGNRPFSASSMASVLVLEDGRIKPFDTYARNLLLRFSGKSNLARLSAVDWLATVIFAPEACDHDPIFLINDPQIPEALGIAPVKNRRYSYAQLYSGMERLSEAAQKAWERDLSMRTAFDKEVIRIHRNISDYMSLASTFSFVVPHEAFTVDDETAQRLGLPSGAGSVSYADLLIRSNILRTCLSRINTDSEEDGDVKLFGLARAMYSMGQAIGNPPVRLIPSGKNGVEDWYSPWGLINAYYSAALRRAELSALLAAREAYARADRVAFDGAIGVLKEEVRRSSQTALPNPQIEILYNRFDPFGKGKLLYAIACIFAFAGLAAVDRRLRCIAMVMVIAGLIVHTAGLVARMLISGRPPVTNLYETFVFVAWACAILGVIIELAQRGGPGTTVASVSGFLLLHIAGRYGAAEGDTIRMLSAVLASNFWLSTHIITISLGYAGCIAASVLGHVYMVRSVFGGSDLRSVDRALYGMLTFGFCFTIAGTVLGGMWADRSWGRFWGWDPKENGALLIILWCAAVLHARHGSMIGEFGTAVSAIIAAMLVLFVWLGVNLLGVGLHSYGFSNTGAGLLAGATALEILFIGIFSVVRWARCARKKA